MAEVRGEGSEHGDNIPPEINGYVPIKDRLNPVRQTTPSCIVLPLNRGNFTFRPGVIQLLPTFHGIDSENPYNHLREFEEVSNTCLDQNTNEDVVRLQLFPFSLKDKAKFWLNSLRPRSIGTWREMQTEFLKKYFPTQKTQYFRRQITSFSCKPNENFSRAWERFKDLLMACPHHGFEPWRLVSIFHESLTPSLKQLVSTMCNGTLFDKTEEEAMEFFDMVAENSNDWEIGPPSSSEHRNPVSSGHIALNEGDDFRARLAALQHKLDSLELKNKEKLVEAQVVCWACDQVGHDPNSCPELPLIKEAAYSNAYTHTNQNRPFHNRAQGNSSYSNGGNVNYQGGNHHLNTYSPGWANSPNFGWKNDNPSQSFQPPPLPQPQHSQFGPVAY